MSARTWATPLTVGAFLLISVTGILMFFHLETGLNKAAHEWLGWILLLGVGAHLWVNWRPFSVYFKRPAAVAIMGAGAAVLAASFLPLGQSGESVPVRQVLEGLATAPLTSVAAVAGKDPALVLADLGASYPQATADQSLADLAGGDVEAGVHLLAQVFAAEASE